MGHYGTPVQEAREDVSHGDAASGCAVVEHALYETSIECVWQDAGVHHDDELHEQVLYAYGVHKH